MPAAFPSIFACTDFLACLGDYDRVRKASERNFTRCCVAAEPTKACRRNIRFFPLSQ